MPLTLGMLAGSSVAEISDPAIVYHGFIGGDTTNADQTYTAVPIGAPAPDRVLHIVVSSLAGTSTTANSVYLDGWYPMARHGFLGVLGFPYDIFTCPWPNGTTADIRVITDPQGGSLSKRALLIHSLYGMSEHIAFGVTNGGTYGSTIIQAKGALWCDALSSTNANTNWSGTLPPTPQTYTNVTEPNGQKHTGCGNVFAARSTGTMVPGGTNVMSMRSLIYPKKPDASTYIPRNGNYNQPYSVAPAIAPSYVDLAIPSLPAADRFVVVGLALGAAAGTRSITSVTIGGVAATLLSGSPAGLSIVAFYGATVPNGTTATVDVVADRSVDNLMMLWSMKGSGANAPAGSNGAYNNASSATNNMTLNVPEKGTVFFGWCGVGFPYGSFTGVGGIVPGNMTTPATATRYATFGCLYGAPATAAYTTTWSGNSNSTARSIAGVSFASVD